MKHFAFVINPNSGLGNKSRFIRTIEKEAQKMKFDFSIYFTQRKYHASELARGFVGKVDGVFAVGGDGTVNEIASALLNSNTPMGIIPAGSGNGLARHLHIPLMPGKALKELINGDITSIDSGTANGQPFFMLAGLGFDAHIAEKISQIKLRGKQAYFRLVTKEFVKFNTRQIHAEWEGGDYSGNPFLFNIANATQFGNNMKIAPSASLKDGFFDIGIMEKPALQQVPELLLRMWNGSLHQYRDFQSFRGKEILIQSNYKGINIDGEYVPVKGEITVKLLPDSLKIIVPKGKGNRI